MRSTFNTPPFVFTEDGALRQMLKGFASELLSLSLLFSRHPERSPVTCERRDEVEGSRILRDASTPVACGDLRSA